MGFPPKEFLTVSELAARWERAPLQIIDWAMSGKLELMVSLTEAEFQGGEEADYAAVRAGHVRPLFRDAGDAERIVMIRRARPPGSDKPLSIVHPAEGVRVLSTDVLIRTTEIERFEEENSLVRRVVVGPGAPTRHSWERFTSRCAAGFSTMACPTRKPSWWKSCKTGSWMTRTGVKRQIRPQFARKSKWYGKGSSPTSAQPAQRRLNRRNSPDLSAGFCLCAGLVRMRHCSAPRVVADCG